MVELLSSDSEMEFVDQDRARKKAGNPSSTRKRKPAKPSSHRPAVRAGTLVVTPTTVLNQWARELQDKVSPDVGAGFLALYRLVPYKPYLGTAGQGVARRQCELPRLVTSCTVSPCS